MDYKFKLDRTTLSIPQAPRPSAGAQALAFVNVDDPGQVKHPATQRKIRRHVMLSIGQSRRKSVAHPDKRCQDATDATALQHIPRPPSRSAPSYWGDIQICVNFRRLFHAMDMVSKGLLSIAVKDAVRDSGERLSERLYRMPHGNKNDQVQSLYEIKQYTDSLSLVRKSFHATENSAGHLTIIGTVVCLAHFDLRIGNYDGWAMHMRGLDTIIKRYGDVEMIESHQALRQSLFLTDVLGSVVYDTRPRFPQLQYPYTSTFAAPKLLLHKLHSTSQTFGIDSLPSKMSNVVIETALRSASQFAFLLNQVPRHSMHQLALDIMVPVCRIAHDILSLPRLNYNIHCKERPSCILGRTPFTAAAELVRRSALALVSSIIYTTSGDSMYCPASRRGPERELLAYTRNEGWIGWEELRLWVLVIQAMLETEAERVWLLDEIIGTMDSLSLQSWDSLVVCLHQVAWVSHVAMQEMVRLKTDIESRLSQKAGT